MIWKYTMRLLWLARESDNLDHFFFRNLQSWSGVLGKSVYTNTFGERCLGDTDIHTGSDLVRSGIFPLPIIHRPNSKSHKIPIGFTKNTIWKMPGSYMYDRCARQRWPNSAPWELKAPNTTTVENLYENGEQLKSNKRSGPMSRR